MNDLNNKKELLEKLVVIVQKEQSHDAFGEVYEILVDPVHRYVFYRVKGEDVEDIVENLFLKVWENIGKYRSRKNSSFVSWVFRIAHNLVVDYYRKSERDMVEVLSDFVVDQKREHNPIKMTKHAFDEAKLKKAMGFLSDKYNEVITLKYFNGFSNVQIAEIMKCSEGNVRVLQFRALKELKVQLSEMGVDYA
ncbi:hypothetical protein CVV38_04510 [Candidatus Peregrinibacteria bacterium HGW-Peregrinibacteria-1]|jgi:RNA polymerase sigma-70 factor (ECF subfamily)|nr:MAG: hypothetical protein CVV38_04510 [Candidatus Peregrinibacteria bacterium HGW-Peregrinibacteria-1]